MSKRDFSDYSGLALIAAFAMALGPLTALSLGSDDSEPASKMSTATAELRYDQIARHDQTRSIPADAVGKRLIDITGGAGSFEFFNTLVRAANMDGLLQADTPYTLFMPSDRAFSAISGERLSALVNDPEALRQLVATHIVPGRISVSDLMTGQSFSSLDGDELQANAGTHLRVNGASVLATDIAENGVVHFVDGLLSEA